MAEVLIVDNLFPQPLFDRLVKTCKRRYKNAIWNDEFGRWGITTEDQSNDGSWLMPLVCVYYLKLKNYSKQKN